MHIHIYIYIYTYTHITICVFQHADSCAAPTSRDMRTCAHGEDMLCKHCVAPARSANRCRPQRLEVPIASLKCESAGCTPILIWWYIEGVHC